MKKQLLILSCLLASNAITHATPAPTQLKSIAPIHLTGDDEVFLEELEESQKIRTMDGLQQFFNEDEENDSDLTVNNTYNDIVDALNDKLSYHEANGETLVQAVIDTKNLTEEQSLKLWHSLIHAAMLVPTEGHGIKGAPHFHKMLWRKTQKMWPIWLASTLGFGAAWGVLGLAAAKGNPGGLVIGIPFGVLIGALVAGKTQSTRNKFIKEVAQLVEFPLENVKELVLRYHDMMPRQIYQELKSFIEDCDDSDKAFEKHKKIISFYRKLRKKSAMSW